jgi:brefeldin A-inhibited guanine nucleotide-exchange protein
MIGNKLEVIGWDQFTTSICLTFEHTLPREILMIDNDKQDLEKQFTRCLIQLLLVNCLKTTTESFFSCLSIDNIRQLLSVLEESNQFAHQFNTNVELRMKLWKAGFMGDLEDLPGLIS